MANISRADLPNPKTEPELWDLVKTYQPHIDFFLIIILQMKSFTEELFPMEMLMI